MALIKRKQLDLAIKSATAAGVSGGVYGTTNLSALAGGVYAIATGDQYEVVVDKIVGALDAVVAGSASAFYAYTANGAGSVSINLGGTVDFSGTTNQISVSKTNTGSTAVNYTFALPSAVTMPGSLSVTTTLGVTGATTLTGNVTLAGNSQTVTHSGTGNLTITSTNGDVLVEGIGHSNNNLSVPGTATVTGATTLNGALDLNSTAAISGNITLDGAAAQTITHTGATGNLTISSTNGNVLVEGTTFAGNDVTIAGNTSIAGTTSMTGNVTLAGNSQTVTHTGTGNLTIVSSGGSVLVEGISHAGNDISVPGTATVTGATTLNGAVDVNSTVAISGNITLDGAAAQTITHTGATGNLTISSTNGNVLVEGTTFAGNDVTVAGTTTMSGALDLNSTAAISGNITLDGTGAQTITHTAATGNLTISSTNGSVLVEGTTFTGNDVSIAGNLSVVGTITQTAVNDLIVGDRFIKLANGNNGTVTLTGVYQQLNTNSFAGSVYSTSESMFRFFTTTTEPTTGTTPSSLTPATIDFGGFGANGLEALQDAVASFITAGSGIVKTYNDSSNILTISTDNAAISSNINMEVKLAADGVVDTLTVNMGNGSLNLTESDTAFFRKDQSTTGIQLSVRGTIHEDITYSATPTVGKFTVNGTGDAAVILTNTVAPSDFYDNIQNNKEYVQVFVNGIKLRWNEYSFTAGSANLNIYSGNGTVPGGMSGIGYNLDAADTITVLYYGDQNNDTV